MIKVMCVSDVHLSERNPISRKDNYCETMFGKLEQVYKISVEVGVNAVVFPGDLFHLKSSLKNPYRLTIRLIKHLKKYKAAGIPVLVIVGNHDLVFGDIATLEKQPIGVIRELDFVHSSLLLKEGEDFSVRILGIDFSSDPLSEQLALINGIRKQGEDYTMAVTHALIGDSQYYGEPTILFSDLKNPDLDVLLNGHLHSPTLVGKTSEGLMYVCTGALSRGTIAREDIERKVNVVLLGFEKSGIKHKVVEIDSKPAQDVFDFEIRGKELKLGEEVKKFVDNLGGVVAGAGFDPLEILEKFGVSKDVKDIARTYLMGDRVEVESL